MTDMHPFAILRHNLHGETMLISLSQTHGQIQQVISNALHKYYKVAAYLVLTLRMMAGQQHALL